MAADQESVSRILFVLPHSPGGEISQTLDQNGKAYFTDLMKAISEIRVKQVIAAVSAFVLILLLTQATTLFWTSKTITSAGSVKAIGVGVYWDKDLTNAVSYVDWGIIEPGTNLAYAVYIRNEGTSSVTLTLDTANWTPSKAQNYMTLTWDYDGRAIEVGAIVPAQLILSISSDATEISNFSFDVIIVGSG